MTNPITKGAMVVLWTMHLSSLSTMVGLTPRKIILTKEGMANAILTGLVLNFFSCLAVSLSKCSTLVLSLQLELTTSVVIILQKNAKVVSIDGYEDVPVNDEKALQKAVASQPISIAIEAGGRDFQLYQSVSSFSTGIVVLPHIHVI